MPAQRIRNFLCLICFLLALTPDLESAERELGLNVHGFSYHPDRFDSEGNKFEEFNPGAGLNFLFYSRNRNHLFLEGGAFRNSNGKAAGYISLDYRARVVGGFYAGIGLALLKSSSLREGKLSVAPLPIVSYRYRSISLQILYGPRYKDWNRNSVFASYMTWYFRDCSNGK